LYVNKNEKKRASETMISLALYFLFIFFFLLTVMAINAYSQEAHYFLEVIHRDDQKNLLALEVFPEEIFYLEYTNSRDLNPVIDVFQVGVGSDFYLIEERYPWYGVGQECHPSKEIIFEDGMVVVKLNKKLKKLPLRIAYTVEQILKVRNQEYSLNHLAESGDPIDVLITVKGGQKNSE
jgi:hypothetical protein